MILYFSHLTDNDRRQWRESLSCSNIFYLSIWQLINFNLQYTLKNRKRDCLITSMRSMFYVYEFFFVSGRCINACTCIIYIHMAFFFLFFFSKWSKSDELVRARNGGGVQARENDNRNLTVCLWTKNDSERGRGREKWKEKSI